MTIAAATCTTTQRRNFDAVLNGAVVSSLYWPQAATAAAQAHLGNSTLVGLMPALTLCGYAGGVLGQATLMHDLADRSGLLRHGMVLVLGLSMLAAAPTPTVAALACLLVGLGCSLTQRLLALTAASATPSERATAIGRIIACGLLGLVAARALVPGLVQGLGWRVMFGLDAVLCAVLVVAACTAIHEPASACPACANATVWSLWRQDGALRRSALLQALCFALFNAAWELYPRLSGTQGLALALPACVIATLGAASALLAARVCRRFGPARAASGGTITVILGVASAAASWFYPAWAYGSMALIEAGTQLTLVANHAGVQARQRPAEQRGRVAAILTAVGFAGGAGGAAVASLLP